MILPPYHIGPSRIPGAGQGLFLAEPLARGRLITAPDAIPRVYRFEEILAMPDATNLLPATVRWFEDRYTITPEWPDECYINHSFAPTGLWHLGFIFAGADLPPGSEITVDYRHLLAPGQEEAFVDAGNGERIIGYTWQQSLTASTSALAGLLD
ncbi:MAG TPA: SET domain-containing protein [Rhodanobacteraceae bacterium]|nr:SET domain-containing protein [Rhodanobacteraceae bacterium]